MLIGVRGSSTVRHVSWSDWRASRVTSMRISCNVKGMDSRQELSSKITGAQVDPDCQDLPEIRSRSGVVGQFGDRSTPLIRCTWPRPPLGRDQVESGPLGVGRTNSESEYGRMAPDGGAYGQSFRDTVFLDMVGPSSGKGNLDGRLKGLHRASPGDLRWRPLSLHYTLHSLLKNG